MSGRIAIISIAILVAPAWLVPGCSKRETAKATTPHRNVLLIIIDTLRVDKLGCYGNDLGLTPRIDQFARTGVRFEQAYSHAPWTLPACASILTSLTPPQHGAGGAMPTFHRLPKSAHTVAECLRQAGFATAAVINVLFLTKLFRMTQGFDYVDFEVHERNTEARPAEKTTGAALAWLRTNRRQPFFLLVHYFDPHLTYEPPEEYRRRFAAPQDRDNTDWVFGTIRQIVAYRHGQTSFSFETIWRAEQLYNGEVAYTDHEVGRLLDGLRELGLADSTVVALTADHGEEFFDHGGFEHGHTLYNELVHVPLIVRADQELAGRTVASVVAHVDLAPTLCELAGVRPLSDFTGKSLVGLMKGRPGVDRSVVFKGNYWGKPLRGYLHAGYKLILSPDTPPQLFNIKDDPHEKRNLGPSEPDRVARLAGKLERVCPRTAPSDRGDETRARLSPSAVEQLRALGYVEDD